MEQSVMTHDFLLTTVFTVDEFGARCPIAFCIINIIDSMTMFRLFLPVIEKVGLISIKVLMSDNTTLLTFQLLFR